MTHTETNKPVEDWEKDFIWFLGNEALTSEVKNFIKETREQAIKQERERIYKSLYELKYNNVYDDGSIGGACDTVVDWEDIDNLLSDNPKN